MHITKDVECGVGQEILFTCLGDIHYNSEKDCDRERFHALIPWLNNREKYGVLSQYLGYPGFDLKQLEYLASTFQDRYGDPGSKIFIMGTGDYNDPLSPSERAAMVATKGGQGYHDTTLEQFDKMQLDITQTFFKVVEPIKHNFVGLLEGHHYGIYTATDGLRGMRTTEHLAQMLGCPYLGDIVVLTLNFHQYNLKFTVVAMHGYGSARTIGAQVIKRVRMSEVFEGADLYVMGHDNNKAVVSREPLRVGPDGTLGMHKQYFMGAGSFQRGYRFGTPYGTYVEKLALPPHLLGINIAMLRVEKKGRKYRLDYHVSS